MELRIVMLALMLVSRCFRVRGGGGVVFQGTGGVLCFRVRGKDGVFLTLLLDFLL